MMILQPPGSWDGDGAICLDLLILELDIQLRAYMGDLSLG